MTTVRFLFSNVLGTRLTDEILTSVTLQLLVEDEEEATEASHTAVVIEVLLFGQNLYFLVFLLDLFFYFTAKSYFTFMKLN